MFHRIAAAALALSGPVLAQDAQVEQGLTLYQQNCRTCHVMTEGENRLGPSLHGVMGREVGSVEGFEYSDGLAGASGAWDDATMDAFLESPETAYPGNRMLYPGMPDAANRAALIAYMRSENVEGEPDI